MEPPLAYMLHESIKSQVSFMVAQSDEYLTFDR